MSVELKILDFIQTLHTPVLDKIVLGITQLVQSGIIWIVLTLILLIIPKTRRTGGVMLAALLIETVLCNLLLKNIVARTRPCDVNTAVQLLISRPHGYSFPSVHTAMAFSAAGALCFSKNRLWIPVLVFACLIAFSRLYLYVHYPTDVLTGAILGVLCGYIGYKIVNTLMKKKEA